MKWKKGLGGKERVACEQKDKTKEKQMIAQEKERMRRVAIVLSWVLFIVFWMVSEGQSWIEDIEPSLI